MLDIHNEMVGQVSTIELFVEVIQHAFDLNTKTLPPMEEFLMENSKFMRLHTVREIPAKNIAYSSGYQLEFHSSYIPPLDLSGGIETIAGCSFNLNPSPNS